MENSIDSYDWHFDFNKESTSQYYKDFDGLCDCASCRNFYQYAAKDMPDELKCFFEQFGIDVRKPIEQWSVSANKDEMIVDNTIYYAVNGIATSTDNFEIDIGPVNIVVDSPKPDDVIRCPEHSPNTEINKPYFIFTIYNLWTPWVVNDNINEWYPDQKRFVKKIFSILMCKIKGKK